MGKGASQSAEEAARSQADVAKQLVSVGKELTEESKPYRKAAGGFFSDVAAGGPQLERAVAPQINQATQGFAAMKKGGSESIEPGGQRDRFFRDIAVQEAGTKAGIRAGGVNEAVTRLAALGAGGTQAGVGAFGGAGTNFGGASGNFSNVAQQQAANMGGWGQFAGMVAGI